jgi:hypothetical protein
MNTILVGVIKKYSAKLGQISLLDMNLFIKTEVLS